MLFVLPMMANAQTNYTDTIVTVLGDTIACQIKMITPQVVSYAAADGDRLIEAGAIKKKIVNSHPQIVGDDNKPVNPKGKNNIQLAGMELKGASRTWFTGFAISLIGTAVTGAGAAFINRSPTASTGMFIAGGVLTAVGSVTMVVSFSNIGAAGELLDAYDPGK